MSEANLGVTNLTSMTAFMDKLTTRRCVTAQSLQALGVVSTTLDSLPPGRTATILGFDDEDVVSRRLYDLGFAPGLTVALLRRAPLRDPLMFRVDGCEIVLRRREARRILVES